MNFDPKNEQQIAAERLWPAGVYEFEVVQGADKNSKSSGAPMIELRLKLSGRSGATLTITDYLVEKRIQKLLHAARTVGLEAKYKTGSVAGIDFRGKRGKLKLGIEKGQDGYPDKNIVLDYLSDAGLAVR